MDVKARLRSALLSLEDRDLSSQGHFSVKLLIDKLQTAQQASLVVKELVSGLDKCGRSAATNRLLLLSYLLATQGQLGPLRAMPQAMPSLVAYVQRQHHSTNFDDLAALGSRLGQALAAALAADATADSGGHHNPFGAAGGGWGDRDTRQLPDRRGSAEWAGGAAGPGAGAGPGPPGAAFAADPAWALNHVLLPLLRVACRGPERDAMAAACAVLVPLVESLCRGPRGDGSAGAVLGRLLGWIFTLLGSATAPLKAPGVLQLLTGCVQALGPGLDADTAKRILLAATSGLDCGEDWQVRREAANLMRALAALGTSEQAVAMASDPEAAFAAAWIAGPQRREFLMQALEPIRHDKFPAVRAAFQSAYAAVARLPEAQTGSAADPARPALDEYAEPRSRSVPESTRSAARRQSAEGDRRTASSPSRGGSRTATVSAGSTSRTDRRGGRTAAAGGAGYEERERDWGVGRSSSLLHRRDDYDDDEEEEEADEEEEALYRITVEEPSFSERRSDLAGMRRRPPPPLQASADAWRSATAGARDELSAGPSTSSGRPPARSRPQTPGRAPDLLPRARAATTAREALAAARPGGGGGGRRHADGTTPDGSSSEDAAAFSASGVYSRFDLLGPDAARRDGASAGHTVHTFTLGESADVVSPRTRQLETSSTADVRVSPRAAAASRRRNEPEPQPQPGSRAWVKRVLADDDGPVRDYFRVELDEEEEQEVVVVERDGFASARAVPRTAAGAAAAELGWRSGRHAGSPRFGSEEGGGYERLAGDRFWEDDLASGVDAAPGGGYGDRQGRWRGAGGDVETPALLSSKSPRVRSQGRPSRSPEPPRLRAACAAGRTAAAPSASRRRTSPGRQQRHHHQYRQRPLLVQPPWRCPSRGPSPRRARSQSPAGSEGAQAVSGIIGSAAGAPSAAAVAPAQSRQLPSPPRQAAAGVPTSHGAAAETAAGLIYGGGGWGGEGGGGGGGSGAGGGPGSRGLSPSSSRPPRAAAAGGGGRAGRGPAMEAAEGGPSAAASPSGGRRFQRRDTSRVGLGWPSGDRYRPPRGSPRFRRPSAPLPQPDFGVQIFAKEPPPQRTSPRAAPGSLDQAPHYRVNVQTATEGVAALVSVAAEPVGRGPGAAAGDYPAHSSPLRGHPGYGPGVEQDGPSGFNDPWFGDAGADRARPLAQQPYSAAAAAAALVAAGAATAAAAAASHDVDQAVRMTARVQMLGEPGMRPMQRHPQQLPPHAHPYPPPQQQLMYDGGRGMEPGAQHFWSSEDGEGTGSASGSGGGGGGGGGGGASRRGSLVLEHQLQALVEQAQALQASLSNLGRQGHATTRRQRRRWDNQPGAGAGGGGAAAGGPLRRGPSGERYPPPPSQALSLDTAAANAAVQQLQLLLQQAAGAQASLQLLLAGAGTPTNLQGAVNRLEELVAALQQGTAARSGGPGGDSPTASGSGRGYRGGSAPSDQLQAPADTAAAYSGPPPGDETGPRGAASGSEQGQESDIGSETTGALRELIKQVEATRESLTRANDRTAQLLSAGAALHDDVPPGLSPQDAALRPEADADNAAPWSMQPPALAYPGGHATRAASALATAEASPPRRHGGPAAPRLAWDIAMPGRDQQGPPTSGRVRFELSGEGGRGVTSGGGGNGSGGRSLNRSRSSPAASAAASTPRASNRYDDANLAGRGSSGGGSGGGGSGGGAAGGTTAALADIIKRTSSLRLPGEGPATAAGLQAQAYFEQDLQQRYHLPPQPQASRRGGARGSGSPPASYPPAATGAYAADEGRHALLPGSTAALAVRWQQRHDHHHHQQEQRLPQEQQRLRSTSPDRPGGVALAGLERRAIGSLGSSEGLLPYSRHASAGGTSGRSDGGSSDTQHAPQRIIDFRPLLPAATTRPLVVPVGSAGGSSTRAGAVTAAAQPPRSVSPPAHHPPGTSSPIQAAVSRLQNLGAALAPYDPRLAATGTAATGPINHGLSDHGAAPPPQRSSSPPLGPPSRQSAPVYPLVLVPRQPRYPAAVAVTGGAAGQEAAAPPYETTGPAPLSRQREASPPHQYHHQYHHQLQDQHHDQQLLQQQQFDVALGPFASSPSVHTVLAAELSHLSIMTPAASAAPAAAAATRPLGAWNAASTTDAAIAAASRLAALNLAEDTATSRPAELQTQGSRPTSIPSSGRPAVPGRRASGSPHRLAVSSGPYEPPQEAGGGSSFPAFTPRSPAPTAAAAGRPAAQQPPSSSLSAEGVAAPTLTLAREARSDSQVSTGLSSLDLAAKEPMVLDVAAGPSEDGSGGGAGAAEHGPMLRPYDGSEPGSLLRRDPWVGHSGGGGGGHRPGSQAAVRLQALASPGRGRGLMAAGLEAAGVGTVADAGARGNGGGVKLNEEEQPVGRQHQGAEGVLLRASGEVPGRSNAAAGPLGVSGSTGDLVAIASVVELDGGAARHGEMAVPSTVQGHPAFKGYGEQPPGTPRGLEDPEPDGDEEGLYPLPTLSFNAASLSPRVDGDLATMFPITAAAVARQHSAEQLPPRARTGIAAAADAFDLKAQRDDAAPGLRTSYTRFGAMLTPRPAHEQSTGRRGELSPPAGSGAVVGALSGGAGGADTGASGIPWPPLVPSAEPSLSARSLSRQAQGVLRNANLQALRDSATGLARSSLEAVREVEELVVRLTLLQEQLAQGRRVGHGQLSPAPMHLQHDAFMFVYDTNAAAEEDDVFELPLINPL